MSRSVKIALGILVVAVLIGGLTLPGLHRRVLGLGRLKSSEEVARREVVAPPVATPTDVKVKARIYWASPTAPGTLEPVEMELPLSADPVQRAKQVLHELITSPPKPEQRTLPVDAALLEFYLLPDGIVVADFSDALAKATPSGILSERLAVDSIADTLAANVPNVRKLKILIHGQEAETLAGHVDLTGYFPLEAPPRAEIPATAALSPANTTTPPLTPPAAPGKLKP